VRRGARDDTNIIFGATIDERLTGQVWVTVVATGLDGARPARRRVAEEPREADIFEPPSFLQQ
jgi:cell division GTPase FtsZ